MVGALRSLPLRNRAPPLRLTSSSFTGEKRVRRETDNSRCASILRRHSGVHTLMPAVTDVY